MTALHWAAKKVEVEQVKCLLKEGADVKAVDKVSIHR